MLTGKKIVLGITGGIAAYKAALIVRLLVQKGAEVQVIMTPMAKEFITPLTLSTLSRNPVLTDFFDTATGNWNSHVDLGTWADAMLIAPVTANTLAKMVNGQADNLLITTYLSARCPVFLAPAMDLDMFAHPTTRENLSRLKSYGNIIIEPAVGELASGLEGKGRMEDPESIVRVLFDYFEPKDMVGKKILITAGPTYEKIDPVRFIGNYSSGKMGFAVAETCARRGAIVTLVAGPVSLKLQDKSIERINVETAEEMAKAVISRWEEMDGAILAAAVADFTPVERRDYKIKRKGDELNVAFKPTIDIAATLGEMKRHEQFLVGFALENENEEANALAKMERKNFDFIVLNSLQDPNSGFGFDTNKVTILHRSGLKKQFELKSKLDVADDIVKEMNTLIF
ncbi:MAG: phosphopantothenoylcysteine decarboxylase [Paludibacter sp. 47-17]|nr:MAG: bifunctional phosphopantothenoylcysteine decarboxylase/phosphopantothenate--cysteine ligase CoaBC [Paludibacter sp.]OJX90174.1 MAG: phosphopantothenoylcysteine decarboxylase [Paludibacter sp. 47-17]